jgi:hypothetical protein
MQLMELINAAGGVSAIAQQVGISEKEAKDGSAALLPALLGGFKKQATGRNGLDGLTSLLSSVGGGGLLDDVVSPGPSNIDAGNQLLGSLFGSKDVSRGVADQAAQSSGISAATLKKMLPLLAMVAAGLMAKQSGEQSGGGGILGQLGSMFGGGANQKGGGIGQMLDLNGDGNPLDDIIRMAGKAFGR